MKYSTFFKYKIYLDNNKYHLLFATNSVLNIFLKKTDIQKPINIQITIYRCKNNTKMNQIKTDNSS